MKEASCWGSWKVISQLKCLNLSWLTAFSSPIHRDLRPSRVDWLPGNYCQVDPIAHLCHSNARNLVLIRWMSNGIKAFIYFVQHHPAPASLSLATGLPTATGRLTCFGSTKRAKIQEEKNLKYTRIRMKGFTLKVHHSARSHVGLTGRWLVRSWETGSGSCLLVTAEEHDL